MTLDTLCIQRLHRVSQNRIINIAQQYKLQCTSNISRNEHPDFTLRNFFCNEARRAEENIYHSDRSMCPIIKVC